MRQRMGWKMERIKKHRVGAWHSDGYIKMLANRKKSKSVSFDVKESISVEVFAKKLREWLLSDCKNQFGFSINVYDRKVKYLLKTKKYNVKFMSRR